MKNKVYGLVSMVISPDGVIVRDGTLLFPNKEKAEHFLQFVRDISKQNQSSTHMRGSSRSHYEQDREYIVNNTIAENVHNKRSFFVSQIHQHLIENIEEEPSQDATISPIAFVEIEEEPTETNQENIIENES